MANIFTQFITNRIFLICLLTWFVSQSLKFFIHYARHREVKYTIFLSSGNIPSSHSALTMAFTTLVYLDQQISMLFLLSVLVLVLTVHDLLVLQRHTGEHAKMLNMLRGKRGKKLEEVIGHEPMEVLAGLVLGFVMALIFA